MESFIEKNRKKLIVLFIIVCAWLYFVYVPKQNCIAHISLDGGSSYYYKEGGIEEGFKTRNDAIDYCMTYSSIFF